YGLISGVTAGAVASYWPSADFGRIAGRTYIAWCLAAISLPVLAGRLYDLTGGYEMAIIAAGGANLAAVLVALALPAQRRQRWWTGLSARWAHHAGGVRRAISACNVLIVEDALAANSAGMRA